MTTSQRKKWSGSFATKRSPHFGWSSGSRRITWGGSSGPYSETLLKMRLSPMARRWRSIGSIGSGLKTLHARNGSSLGVEFDLRKQRCKQFKGKQDDEGHGSVLNETATQKQFDGEPNSYTEVVGDESRLPPKNRIQELFDWLLVEDWAEQYYSDVTGISIGIGDQKSHDEVKQRLREAGFGDIVEACTITAPHRGRYERTADTNHNHESSANSNIQLKPLSVVHSSSGESTVLYSGSISSQSLPETGLSVGHLFNEANSDEVFLMEGRIPIAKLLLHIDYIQHGRRRLTADISFLKIMNARCRTTNHVTFQGTDDSTEKTLALRLLKEEINAGVNVLIVDQNSHVRRGKIAMDNFVDKKNNLFNVLQITDVGSPRMITDTGDSGALVMLEDSQTDEETAQVVGIVIGKWKSLTDDTTATIANRLWDALQTVGNSEEHCKQLTKGEHEKDGLMTDVDFVSAN